MALGDLLFFVNVAWLFTHELDAIYRYEWRIFQTFVPFYNRMSDEAAYRTFTLLHLPLFAGVLWAMPYQPFQVGFNVFLLVHVGLHWFFRNHPENQFKDWFSWLLIAGSAPLAVLHLILLAG